jgi:hypothetical protein
MIDKLIETGRSYAMQMNMENIRVTRISKYQFPVNPMLDQINWRMWNILNI